MGMRIATLLLAGLLFLAMIGVAWVVQKYEVGIANQDAALPAMTRWVIAYGGTVPMMLLGVPMLVCVVAAVTNSKQAMVMAAGLAGLVVMLVAVAVAIALITPLESPRPPAPPDHQVVEGG